MTDETIERLKQMDARLDELEQRLKDIKFEGGEQDGNK